ncbi:MAG: GtrA family protein [bacterium]
MSKSTVSKSAETTSTPDKTSGNAKHEAAQVGRFGIIGIINTLIDFAALNIITRLFGFPDYIANIPATTIAMTFSFFANRSFVFRAKSHDNVNVIQQAIRFFVTTAIGVWIIQSGLIYFFETIWKVPVELGVQIAGALGILNFVDKQFVITNGVKLVATAGSLIWNYLTYKRFVFKESK